MSLPEARGVAILRDKTSNRSIAFTREERERLGLRGLLPAVVDSQDGLVLRVMEALRSYAKDINKYILLSSLQERNEHLFYQVAMDHIEEVMPLIYTPTVGEACRQYSHIVSDPKGFFITPEDRGEIRKILDNWPSDEVRVIVVTDGERILGLGDLGANGMGIPIGKLALYTACGGIPPEQCLPVLLDVGTNNEALLADPHYLGYPHRRVNRETYFALVEEFVAAVQDKYPGALIQFEDFLTPNAYALLGAYRDRVLCFNDDIQGTAAVALAGVYASSRITGRPFADLRIMFLGAGSASTGIADLMTAAFQAEGLPEGEARRRLWFVDANGLVVAGRTDLMSHNLPYAHAHAAAGFLDAIDTIKPHILIGATGAPGTFTRDVIERMCRINEHPVVFALSNPTSKAECTAAQAFEWSRGKAVFSSGSPFGSVEFEGRAFRPGQANNVYVFPGVGLGATACKARSIPDDLFLAAARALADMVSDEDIARGSLYPPLTSLREISLTIAVRVAERAWELGLATAERPADLRGAIAAGMYDPRR
jgi:malate dehydrogenase (oxaloacetate-decarboxylating)(NADP+)